MVPSLQKHPGTQSVMHTWSGSWLHFLGQAEPQSFQTLSDCWCQVSAGLLERGEGERSMTYGAGLLCGRRHGERAGGEQGDEGDGETHDEVFDR